MLLLVALIVRGVAFEYRGKRDSPRWRRSWSVLLTAGSLLAPLLIGVALGDLLHGVPIDSSQEFTGGLRRPAHPVRRCTWGSTLTVLCGAARLDLPGAEERATRSAAAPTRWPGVLAPVAAGLVLGFVVWTLSLASGWCPGRRRRCSPRSALVAAAGARQRRRSGWAFAATAVAMAGPSRPSSCSCTRG